MTPTNSQEMPWYFVGDAPLTSPLGTRLSIPQKLSISRVTKPDTDNFLANETSLLLHGSTLKALELPVETVVGKLLSDPELTTRADTFMWQNHLTHCELQYRGVVLGFIYHHLLIKWQSTGYFVLKVVWDVSHLKHQQMQAA
jgi:hypothetical protein